MTTKEDIISTIYHDLESGYGSIENTYQQAYKKDSSITLEDVKKWLKRHPNKQRRPYKASNSLKQSIHQKLYHPNNPSIQSSNPPTRITIPLDTLLKP